MSGNESWPQMRPMEKAPRNYTKVLLRWADARDGTFEVGLWDDSLTTGRQWCIDGNLFYDSRFAGWYPLPPEAP